MDVDAVLSHVDADRPDPPLHLSAEAAYGWECGWSAAVAALRVELNDSVAGSSPARRTPGI